MTETSDTTSLRTEIRIARSTLHTLREDLIIDAFAFRPLAHRHTDGPLVSRLPEHLRRSAVWLPHMWIVALTCLVMLIGMSSESTGGGVMVALLAVIPLFMTIFRPVGAWWLSLGVSALTGLAPATFSEWPWTVAGFISHIAVMMLVAARTRPRVAVEMWLITAALALLFEIGGNGRYGSGSAGMIFCSFLGLAAVVAVRGWRETKQQVVEQVAVTEVERSRRTLLEERTVIARELHDVVAHHMSVIAIQAEAAPYRVEDPPAELAKSFAIIRENAVAALTELRRVLGVVRADNPDGPLADGPEAPQPTLANLDSLISNVGRAGLTVEKVVTGAVRVLPQGVELSAYRIVQEALSNVLRHAPGSEARAEISYVLGGIGLRIVNGPSTETACPSPGAGHGILGMRERAAMLGGEMTAAATDEGGYEVVAFLPVILGEGGA